ncbi:YccF domain-containing protein [Bacteroides thetaiotaomicron]|uniref:YccF domain-containing protein n=1 Tax=Bacteroides thetaiotaomicron TaxID=818 RepID=UPI0028F3FC68|nr:YccF domain-containing protein [Bacteroides thetaiotaomicron]WOG18217.1 YccF domain-containing protein [Bacteroides thetaiotaomicron]
MRTLGNIIWHFPYCGFLKSLLYAIGGLFWCITIIGIPLGLGLFQLSLFMLAPFNKGLVSRKELELLTGEKQNEFVKAWSIIIRILYFPFGLFAAMTSVMMIAAEFVTLIGIPCGLVEAKALSAIFNPINKKCVPRVVAEEIERRKASNTLNKYVKVPASQTTVTTQPATGETIQKLEASPSVTDDFLRKAEAKTDEELKSILQHREDYNPQLIKAAEKVLLDRITAVATPKVTVVSNPEVVSTIEAETITAEFDDDKYKAYQPSACRKEEKVQSATKEGNDSFSVIKKDWRQESNEEASGVETPAQTEDGIAPVTDSSKTNLTILISILAGVLLAVGGILAYFFWYTPYAKDRDAPRTYVVANNVFLRSSRMAGVEYNILGKVPYGTEVITYNKLGDWAEVKVNGQEGVIATPYLLDSLSFALLNGVWGDNDTKECIESSKCRLAILDYLKKNYLQSGPNAWQLYTRPINQKPNTVFYPRIFDKYSKYTDFVFIIGDNVTGNRVLVCYSFEDATEKPVFRFSMGAPQAGFIKNIVPKYGGVKVIFDNNEYLNISL